MDFTSIQNVLLRIKEIKNKFGANYEEWAVGEDTFDTYLQGEVQKIEEQKNNAQTQSVNEQNSVLNPVNEKNTYNNAMDVKDKVSLLADKYSQKYGVDKNLILSIIEAESGFNPEAVSPKGALGLMQLMPSTAEMLGVKNPLSPEENLDGGVKYLKGLIDNYQGNLPLALSAYNTGSGNVKKYGGVPPFSETKNYIEKVLQRYKELEEK